MVSHPELCSDPPIGSDRDSGCDSSDLPIGSDRKGVIQNI